MSLCAIHRGWHWLVLAGLVLAGSEMGVACRYNVRDLGFIDVGDSAYRLYVYPGPDTPGGQLDQVSEVVGASLSDSNLDFVLCHSDGGPTPEAKAAFQAHPDLVLPGAVLSSPDGQTFPLSFHLGQPGWETQVAAELDALVHSPARAAITRLTAQTFAVVLLLEGSDSEATQSARAAIQGAIEQTRTAMAWMPKSIARAPEMVVLEPAAQRNETVLLWSLGLEAASIPDPRAAVIYGRSRWMGPIAQGKEITEDNLARLLGIIGIDCECGMDLAWTRGTRLPVRWGQAMYQQVAESLGFDPENPMVKIEAGRILSRYGGLARPTVGYSEISLASEEPASSGVALQGVAVAQPEATSAARPLDPKPVAPDDQPATVMIKRLLLVGGSFGALVLALAAAVLWRAWRQGHPKL